MSKIIDFKARIGSVTASDGSVLPFSDDDVVIVVGPNNAGKSQFLRDIEEHFSNSPANKHNGRVVSRISIRCDNIGNFEKAIERYADGNSNYVSYDVGVHSNALIGVKSDKGEVLLGRFAPFFVKRVSADARLSITDPSPALGPERARTPAQILFDNQLLLSAVSSVFRKAFGKDLFLDYRCGGQIPIYVGERPLLPPGCDRVSDEYVSLVRACDKLHEQGDGMKSFGGILLSTLVVKYNVTLIDEPEAFLHPPQERIIGKLIAENADGQIICATHSRDVLQGFLESDRKDIRVIRIKRDGGVNTIHEINASEVRELWNDPVFRYSTALDGLFHDRVVLCEADPDCKFYEAIESSLDSARVIDSHFVPCGGKAAYPKFIRAMAKLDIPVLCILDLDVLNDEDMIRRIYEAQGGVWSDVSTLWRRVDAAVRKGVPVSDRDQTKGRIVSILDKWISGAPPSSDIVECLKQTKPWAAVKAQGIGAVPAGDASKALDELLANLAARSIFAVPVGTLENFVKSVGNHGIKWLNGVFAEYELNSDKLAEARSFVRSALRND